MLVQEVASIDIAPTALAVISADARIIDCSQVWRTLLHFAQGDRFDLLLSPSDDTGDRCLACLKRVLKTGVTEHCYSLFVWTEQAYSWIRWTIKKMPDTNLLFLHAEDISNALQYQQFFDISVDLFMSIDSVGKIRMINQGGLAMLGYDRGEMIGRELTNFILPEDHEKTYMAIDLLLKEDILSGFENRYRAKDGSIKWIEWAAKYYPSTGYVSGIGRDITAKKIEQRALETDHELLNALSTIQELYISGSDINVLFNEILKQLLKVSESEYGFIGAVFRKEDKKPYLKTYAISNIAWNDETRAFYEKNAPSGLEFYNLNTLFGYTLKTGEIVLSNDPKNDPRSGGLPEDHPTLSAYLGMPVKNEGELVGMLGVANRPNGYSEHVVDRLKPLVKVISSIIKSHFNATEVEKMAHYDFLTQLYNRAYFEKKLLQEMESAKKTSTRFALMYLDLNKFKNINDTLGHKIGDMLLFNVAKRLKACLRDYDILARLGGDEFGVLIPQIEKMSDIVIVAKKIMTTIKVPFHVGGYDLKISLSIGISVFPDSAMQLDLLYKYADYALYQAKQQHEDFVFYSKDIEQLRNRRILIENRLEEAIEKGELFFEFQPQIDMHLGRATGVELLLRWQHPVLGLLSPNEFVPIYEDMGKVQKLNTFVVREALWAAKHICANCHLRDFTFCLNISPNVLNFMDNIRLIRDFIERSCLSEQVFKIEFELTESSVMHQQNIAEALREFHSAGVSIAIDDFGIAHSSLHRLKTLPIKTLKLDISLVEDVHQDNKTQIIVKSVVDLADALGLKIVAEGVETESQVSVLKALGCRYVQGNYFSRPVSISVLKAWLNHREQNN